MANIMQTAIGLMSGTSLDGIDAALIRTDGHGRVERIGFYTMPYPSELRDQLRGCLGLKFDPDGRVARAERAMTLAHAGAVAQLRQNFSDTAVDLIGFHGQTIDHDPAMRRTWQIGDAALLAAETGIDVIADFRSADVAAGGQGAPLLPLYHAALAQNLEKPVAVLNIGGVANVTFIGAGDNALLAFDTGPGSALLNDWVKQHTGAEYDRDGLLARAGTIDRDILASYLADDYFSRPAPKSLDRDQWNIRALAGLSVEDGAATLTALTVRAIAKACDHLPESPLQWYVTGGGRLNPAMMDGLRRVLNVPVGVVDDLGWDGDAMEAEGFAYLAVRSALGLPLSLPGTTNVPQPLSGGQRWSA